VSPLLATLLRMTTTQTKTGANKTRQALEALDRAHDAGAIDDDFWRSRRRELESQAEPVERLAFSIRETARLLGISHATVRVLIRDGRLRAVSAGRKFLVPKAVIDAYLDGER
jgi:excisionase family DNA binding protein